MHWVAELLQEIIKCSKLPERLEGESQWHDQHSHLHFLIVKTTLSFFNQLWGWGRHHSPELSKLFIFFLVYSISTFILKEIHIHSICSTSCSSYLLLDSHITICQVNFDGGEMTNRSQGRPWGVPRMSGAEVRLALLRAQAAEGPGCPWRLRKASKTLLRE